MARTKPKERTKGERSANKGTAKQGLSLARLLMVFGSFSPLIFLWTVRGIKAVPDEWLVGAALFLILVPNLVLLLRHQLAKAARDVRVIRVGRAEDHREHILVYLFAMLLPFYAENPETPRQAFATVTALAFVVFLFWHLNLHYVNIAFAVLGYRIFTVTPAGDHSAGLTEKNYALITKRPLLAPDSAVTAIRLSDTVYVEVDT